MASSSMAGEQERSKSMAGEQERGKTTPRIKSGNCSVLLSNSSTSNSNNPSTGSAAASNDIYDKQMAWRLHGQRKIQSRAHELTNLEALECTFTPKTNRSKRRALPDSPPLVNDDSVTAAEMASPSSPLRFRSSESVFSFADDSSCCSPSSSTMRPSASITATAGTGISSGDGNAAPIHPTESQESSIQLHLVRQERAREHAQEARQKLFASSGPQHKAKDFAKVTAFAPFKLSVGNQKPRANSASPTKTRQRTNSEPPSTAHSNNTSGQSSPPNDQPRQQQQGTATGRENGERSKSFKKSSRAQSMTAAAANYHQQQQQHLVSGSGSVNQQQESREETWDKERSSLLSLLDTQRRELEQREKAQQEALQIAESFANAIQSFEERLVAVESSTAQELASIRELLQRQAIATDLILQSLGIAQLPPATSSTTPLDSPPLRSPTSAASTLRRETK
ncbi:hypothetical protein Gpo141_00003967 [Globisporangium polare]